MEQMKVTLVAARDTVQLEQSGKLRSIRHYEYTVDELGPFVFEVPAE